jgi:hypothetical protein
MLFLENRLTQTIEMFKLLLVRITSYWSHKSYATIASLSTNFRMGGWSGGFPWWGFLVIKKSMDYGPGQKE